MKDYQRRTLEPQRRGGVLSCMGMICSAALLGSIVLYLFAGEQGPGEDDGAPATVPVAARPAPEPRLAPPAPEVKPPLKALDSQEKTAPAPPPETPVPAPAPEPARPAVGEEDYAALIDTLLTGNDESDLLPVINKLKELRDPRTLLKLQEAMERHAEGSRIRSSMSLAFRSIAAGLRYPENLYVLSSHSDSFRRELFMEFERKMTDWRERPETRLHFEAVRKIYLDRKAHVWAREGAAWFIGKVRYPESLDILAEGMDPRELWANRTAVVALRELHDQRSVVPLLRATGFSDGVTRLLATLALEETALAEKDYEAYLDHDDKLVRGGAKLMLRKIRAAAGRRGR